MKGNQRKKLDRYRVNVIENQSQFYFTQLKFKIKVLKPNK